MKIAISAVLVLASLGLLGVAVAATGTLRKPAEPQPVAAFGVPAFPSGAAFSGAPAEARPIDAKPADARPADAKPADAKPADAKAADAKAADAKAAEAKPAAEKPPEAKPAPAPAPVAARPPAPAPVAARPPAAPPPEALLNLRASDTADVFVDGKKAGTSPVEGFKVRPGKHKVRFDCYDGTGATVKGPEKAVEVRALEEKDVEFECATEAAVPKGHEDSPY